MDRIEKGYTSSSMTRLLPRGIAGDARYQIVEKRASERCRELPDIRALDGSSGTDRFDVTKSDPLRQTRIRDAERNHLNMFMAVCAGNVSRYTRIETARTCWQLIPARLSTVGT